MTDKELAAFGERLYGAVLLTPLPAGTILGLAAAIRQNVEWADLPRSLRFAVFKIAAICVGDVATPAAESPLDEGSPIVAPGASDPGIAGEVRQPNAATTEQPADGEQGSEAGAGSSEQPETVGG
jgi:hypothetical protein